MTREELLRTPTRGPRRKPVMPSNVSAETGRPIVRIVDARLSFSEACAIARQVASGGYHVVPASTRVEFIAADAAGCRYCGRRRSGAATCEGCGAPRMGRS